MNLESQVCSLELSQRLKELGVRQESLFYWSKLSIQAEYKLELRRHMQTGELVLADCTDYVSAFTVAELGEMLPKGGWNQESTEGGTRVWAHDDMAYTWDANEAKARAKMLIHLIENGLMELPK